MRHPRTARRNVHLQFGADDLSADRLGQIVPELDDSRILVRSGPLLDVVLDIFFEFLGRFCALHENDARLGKHRTPERTEAP